MSRIAFIIIDMQNNCKEQTPCKETFEKAVEYINEVSEYFRRNHLPVVIVQDMEGGGPETEGFACVEELVVAESDYHVHKSFCNSFWNTELDQLLKKEKVDGVVISGFAAEHCVVFTYNGAIERGYQTFLLQHGIAGFEEEEIRKIQQLRPVIAYEALEYFIHNDF